MITLTDYDGFSASYNDANFITVTPYTQNGVAGSKIEYLTNTYTIGVVYVTSIPSAISGSSIYVQPLTIVLDNGQTEVFYLNPLFYKSYTAVGSNTQLIYRYEQASQPQAYITSTSTSTINAQIAAVMPSGGGGSVYQITMINNGTDTYTNADIDFSVPSGLTSINGKNLIAAFVSGVEFTSDVTDPVLPAAIGTQIVFGSGAPAGDIMFIVS